MHVSSLVGCYYLSCRFVILHTSDVNLTSIFVYVRCAWHQHVCIDVRAGTVKCAITQNGYLVPYRNARDPPLYTMYYVSRLLV